MKAIPDWLILCVWRALIGEIYPAIRAVAISISEKNSLVIRYYLEREPVDFDYESLEVVATNVTALIGAHSIPHIKMRVRVFEQAHRGAGVFGRICLQSSRV